MKHVTIPAQWLQELIALCGPEDHELRERVMKSAAPAPVDALATGGQAQAVATLTEEALAEKIRSHGAYGGLAAHLMPFIAQHAAPQAQADARDAESQQLKACQEAFALYIDHVGECEGVDFLDDRYGFSTKLNAEQNEQLAIAIQLDKERRN